MALTWTPKAPGDVYRYTWTPALADGDSLASYTVAETGAVIDYEAQDGNAVVLFVSGGTAGAVASFAFEATSAEGETLTETVYLPIRATANTLGNTVRDVVEFALRKITGLGEEPTADQSADALERLNDMLAMWRIDGMDIGIAGPLALGDDLKIADEFLSPVKFNLRVACHDHYGAEQSAYDVNMAEMGKRLVATRLLTPIDLAMSTTLAGNPYSASDLF